MGVNRLYVPINLAEFNLPVTGCVINRMTPDLDHSFIQTRGKMREKMWQSKAALPSLTLHEVE